MDEKKLGLKWLAMREGKFNEWGVWLLCRMKKIIWQGKDRGR